MIINFFHHIQTLRISAKTRYFYSFYPGLLDANRWEQLISTHMKNLSVFDFQYEYHEWHYNNNRAAYETAANKFNSLFWIERQWFFESQFYRTSSVNNGIFYSINPYKYQSMNFLTIECLSFFYFSEVNRICCVMK